MPILDSIRQAPGPIRAAALGLGLTLAIAAAGHAQVTPKVGVPLTDYFPPPEFSGGWRTMLPASGPPDDSAKAEIRKVAGVDWDKLEKAWAFNAANPGKTGMVVIRRGRVVGEWYKDADKATRYNIYSSSKSYTSLAFGLILSDFGNPTAPVGTPISLDTKVCDAEWMPDALPLPDPRKAGITVRHLLNMAGGLGEEAVPDRGHYEWALGHVEKSPFARLKSDPGKEFHYSNAGVAHLVLTFRKAARADLLPFLKSKVLDPIGETELDWHQVGGDGKIGPLSQGFSGIHTNPREHARFCYLAMHKGLWGPRRLVPESYFDFAWAPSPANPGYGGQWWTSKTFPGVPADFVATLGRNNNDGFVVPSLDLVAVRLGDGSQFPKDFQQTLARMIVESVEP